MQRQRLRFCRESTTWVWNHRRREVILQDPSGSAANWTLPVSLFPLFVSIPLLVSSFPFHLSHRLFFFLSPLLVSSPPLLSLFSSSPLFLSSSPLFLSLSPLLQPCLIRTEDFYQTEDSYYIVLELWVNLCCCFTSVFQQRGRALSAFLSLNFLSAQEVWVCLVVQFDTCCLRSDSPALIKYLISVQQKDWQLIPDQPWVQQFVKHSVD